MKLFKAILILAFLAGVIVLLVCQISWPIVLDQDWTPPVRITETEHADVGGGNLYKWGDTVILLKDQHDRSTESSRCSILIRNNDPSNSWTQLPLSGFPGGYDFHCPTMDQTNGRMLFDENYLQTDKLEMDALFVHMSKSGEVQVEAKRQWTADKKTLFGGAGQNVKFAYSSEKRQAFGAWGPGVIDGSEIYLPYCVDGETHDGNLPIGSEGPCNNGVFHSTDLGVTWQAERISDAESLEPSVCKTKGYYYYTAFKDGGYSAWFSRKDVRNGSWDEPQLLTKTSAHQRGSAVLAANDTVHACWLDRRHEKSRINFAFPLLGNYEVAYCQRKDSDSAWRKDIILSKGLVFSYWPKMSVEGDKIVVVWDGGESGEFVDIYYATSKDGGKTWAKPLKVTDTAKNGMRSERPQVVVLNGVIHLFYAQGRPDRKAQVGHEAAWPVYYQQRPFPN